MEKNIRRTKSYSLMLILAFMIVNCVCEMVPSYTRDEMFNNLGNSLQNNPLINFNPFLQNDQGFQGL
jgi:hypothetical protein